MKTKPKHKPKTRKLRQAPKPQHATHPPNHDENFAADIDAMRKWRGRKSSLRTILLLIQLDRILNPGGLKAWLERSNPNLDGKSPADLIKREEWQILGDMIDDILVGNPM